MELIIQSNLVNYELVLSDDGIELIVIDVPEVVLEINVDDNN